MSLIRFVHTADLHLDRQFRGIRGTPRRVTEVIQDATCNAFQRIVDFSIEQEAHALLIAGDIYDGADRSLRAQLQFVEGLERLDAAGIRTFVCHGQSDPLDDWTARLRLPPAAHRFGPVAEAVSVGPDSPVEVIGVSSASAQPYSSIFQSITSAASARFTIGMFHGELPSGDTALSRLAPAIDYWALGMHHNRQVVREQNPPVIYPGTPQGTRAEEDGPHGAYLIDVDDNGAMNLHFEALDAVRWAHIDAEVLHDQSKTALIDRLIEGVEEQMDAAQGLPIIYQVSLFDTNRPSHTLPGAPDADDIASQLNELYAERGVFAWCRRIVRAPSERFDRQKRMLIGDVVAHVLRLSDDLQTDSDLRQGVWDELSVLLDDSRFQRYASNPGLTEDELKSIIRTAEAAVLDALGTHP